ncbi:MAG: WbqC family protein [Bacteroidaceae bacterium]
MHLSSHQSVFLPWAGFWHKAHSSDVMVINSGSDFCRQDYEHRVKINDAWLTLEIDRAASGKSIGETHLKQGTVKKAADRIERELYLRKNPFKERLGGILGLMRNYDEPTLKHLNELLILELSVQLLIPTTFLFIHEVPAGETKTEKLGNRVHRYMREDDIYICGSGASDYLDFGAFGYPVQMQTTNAKNIDTNSILSLMVKQEDPMTTVNGWFTNTNVIPQEK